MKKIVILLFVSILLVSCGKKNEKWEWMIEEAWVIVDEYVDTLEGSVIDARDVKQLIEWNQDKLQDNLKNIY